MNGLSRTVAPALLPVPLAEFKAHARIEFADDDEILREYLTAAVDFFDGPMGRLGRCILPQTWQFWAGAANGGLRINIPDITAVRVFRQFADAQEVELDPANITLAKVSSGTLVDFVSATLSQDKEFRIEFEAGFPEVPATIKTAIKFLAVRMYENPTGYQSNRATIDLVDTLIAPHRWVSL